MVRLPLANSVVNNKRLKKLGHSHHWNLPWRTSTLPEDALMFFFWPLTFPLVHVKPNFTCSEKIDRPDWYIYETHLLSFLTFLTTFLLSRWIFSLNLSHSLIGTFQFKADSQFVCDFLSQQVMLVLRAPEAYHNDKNCKTILYHIKSNRMLTARCISLSQKSKCP